MTEALVMVQSARVAWIDATSLTELPRGVEVKILNRDESDDRVDWLIRFPPGYLEPRHVHAGRHITIVLEGKQIVEGTELGPGDYVYGPADIPHGPFEYPAGCLLFGSMWGRTVHEY